MPRLLNLLRRETTHFRPQSADAEDSTSRGAYLQVIWQKRGKNEVPLGAWPHVLGTTSFQILSALSASLRLCVKALEYRSVDNYRGARHSVYAQEFRRVKAFA